MGTEKELVKGSDYDPIQTKDEHKKFPRAVFVIVLNEFCERFSYSGMRAFLALYLKQKLMYSNDEATEIYHIFTTMAYFCSIFGAILADNYIGKFRTILYLMVVYAVGNIILAVTAIPPLGIPGREFTLLGLMMVGLGTGGIKPCVSSFGGDQFILPQQEKQLTTFFSILYFILCLGSVVAKSISPLLRSKIQCFGDKDCFSVAFGAPGILIIISIIIFYCAKKMYIIKKPSGNILSEVIKCIYESIRSRKYAKNTGTKYAHWLDYAQGSYDKKFIEEIKKTLQIFLLFTPLPIFWALLDQLGSRWTLQATNMDGKFGFITVRPDQMQVLCPISVLVFILVFKKIIYPFLTKFNILTNLLHRLAAGCVLAALAYICTGLVEMRIQKTYPKLPTMGEGQIRMFNGYSNCAIHLSNELSENITIKSMEMHTQYIATNKTLHQFYNTTVMCNGTTYYNSTEIFRVEENKANSYFFQNSNIEVPSVLPYDDHVDKSRSGLPYVRILSNVLNNTNIEVMLMDYKGNIELLTNSTLTMLTEVFAGEYNLYVNSILIPLYMDLRIGGVYTIVIDGNDQENYSANVITVTEPNSVSMAWVAPQIIIISAGEVLFSITGLEFAFKEAPESMKAVLQAYWLLIEAFGNIVIIIVTRLGSGYRQVYHFFFFAFLMLISTIIFCFLTNRYEKNKLNSTYPEPEPMPPGKARLSIKYMEVMQIDDTIDH